jgi:hypothetical protein
MLKIIARVLGVLVAVLAIAGFFIEGDYLLGVMNVDITLDVVRTVIAIALLIVGFANVPDRAVHAVVGIVGAMYVLMGILAIFDRTLFGILPTGFTGFDIAFHLVVGAGSLVAALLPERAERKVEKAAGNLNPGGSRS